MCVCDAGKFFWFLLFNYLTLIYFTFFGTLLLSVLTHTLTSLFFHVRSLHEASVVAIEFKLQDVTELGLCCMCDIPSNVMLCWCLPLFAHRMTTIVCLRNRNKLTDENFWMGAGMMAVALTPNIKLAAVCSAYVYSLFNLFAGFTITQPNMPGWW